MNYFDNRALATIHPQEVTDRELERLPSRWVNKNEVTTELYTADSLQRTLKKTVEFNIRPAKHLYPRPPTEEWAKRLYLNDEIDETEFEDMLETALKIGGINWGGVEV